MYTCHLVRMFLNGVYFDSFPVKKNGVKQGTVVPLVPFCIIVISYYFPLMVMALAVLLAKCMSVHSNNYADDSCAYCAKVSCNAAHVAYL